MAAAGRFGDFLAPDLCRGAQQAMGEKLCHVQGCVCTGGMTSAFMSVCLLPGHSSLYKLHLCNSYIRDTVPQRLPLDQLSSSDNQPMTDWNSHPLL